MRSRALLLLVTLSQFAFALTVNKLNGGASVVYVDFAIPGPVVPLELVRTYNSITAVTEGSGWNGAFGWGWTTPFETTITITPDRNVLLRDGVTGNTVTFKSEKEDPKLREAFMQNIRNAYFEQKLGRKIKDEELAKLQLPDRLQKRLQTDPQFRVEIATKYDITGTVPRGEMLVSSEYGYQTIHFRDNQWIRDQNGVTQIFDKDGRLVRQRDRNGYHFDFRYSGNKMQIQEISAQDRTTSLKFTWRNDRIVEIIDNRGKRARYSYDTSGNLLQAADSTGQVHIYKYENKRQPHLLTRIEYPGESTPKNKVFREMKYDEKGLATFHREKDGTEFDYAYGKKPNDPENNFWTKTVKRGTPATEEVDEFYIKNRPDGSRYLYKQENRTAKDTVITVFAPCCAKPMQITRNGQITNFKYYENGLLQEKVGPKEEVRLEYDPRWKKVTRVNLNGVISRYEYDGSGNLTKAANSKGQTVTLKYDRFGRIQQMNDSGKELTFKYGDIGKPSLISERNVGSIRITYDNLGRIAKTETILPRLGGRKPSDSQSQDAVRRVMKSFQHLLDILRPAGVNLS